MRIIRQMKSRKGRKKKENEKKKRVSDEKLKNNVDDLANLMKDLKIFWLEKQLLELK